MTALKKVCRLARKLQLLPLEHGYMKRSWGRDGVLVIPEPNRAVIFQRDTKTGEWYHLKVHLGMLKGARWGIVQKLAPEITSFLKDIARSEQIRAELLKDISHFMDNPRQSHKLTGTRLRRIRTNIAVPKTEPTGP